MNPLKYQQGMEWRGLSNLCSADLYCVILTTVKKMSTLTDLLPHSFLRLILYFTLYTFHLPSAIVNHAQRKP